MKTIKIYLPFLFFVFSISFAQNKIAVQKVDENTIPTQIGYPIDARPMLDAFDRANGIDIEHISKQYLLRKTNKTAWNFIVGTQRSFWAKDNRKNAPTAFYQTSATCKSVGAKCYIFVEDSMWQAGRINQSAVNSIQTAFDASTPANSSKGIYDTDVDTYGVPPNIDNDPRIIILILNIRDDYVPGSGYIAGYFHSINEYTSYQNSNQMEMFFIDCKPLDLSKSTGSGSLETGLSTLAHEFQHMIQFNYHGLINSGSQDVFFNEGCSLIAEVINGYPLYSQTNYYNISTNRYMLGWDPNNDATDVLKDYSRAARFFLYLKEQFGVGVLKSFTQSSRTGVDALDIDALPSVSTSRRFSDIVVDWWIANYLNDKSIDPKWGYTYPNVPKVSATTTYLDPNVTYKSDAVYKLGAQYISYASGNNLSANFNTNGKTSIQIKAIETGPSGKRVLTVTPGTNFNESNFGSGYTNVTFLVCQNDANESVSSPNTTPFSYSYTSEGTAINRPIEIKYDEGDTKSALGGWQLSPSDTIAVFFDGVNGTRLDSIKVGLRNDKQITGYIYNTKNQGSRINKTISSPFVLTGTFTPARDPSTSLFPVPWPNMAKVDLRSQNIDSGNPFAVSFVYAGTNSNNIVVVEHTPSEYYHSLTYLNNPSSGSPGWYYLSSSSSAVGLYLIRAYVSSFTTGVSEVIELMPSAFKLDQNYPNPFNPSTVISYTLPKSGNVEIKIYDSLGKEVRSLINEEKNAGKYNIMWDSRDNYGGRVSSGIYFYTIRSGSFAETKKMVLLK